MATVKESISVSKEIIQELIQSYWMEIETVQNYLANSVNLDGVRAHEIKDSLGADVEEELGHARQLAERINVLGGIVPGSQEFRARQTSLQPPQDTTDLQTVIRGVIEAEEEAIAQYRKIIELCDGVDYATQDLCIDLMADEEAHRREFIGFLAEFDKKAAQQYLED
ncbi:MAG TPA: ferritin-like domain-containing protein [Acidobacteriota bacterium]|nr:ferritin-like domain-containing protein [Acidobacteriota bacterium]